MVEAHYPQTVSHHALNSTSLQTTLTMIVVRMRQLYIANYSTTMYIVLFNKLMLSNYIHVELPGLDYNY